MCVSQIRNSVSSGSHYHAGRPFLVIARHPQRKRRPTTLLSVRVVDREFKGASPRHTADTSSRTVEAAARPLQGSRKSPVLNDSRDCVAPVTSSSSFDLGNVRFLALSFRRHSWKESPWILNVDVASRSQIDDASLSMRKWKTMKGTVVLLNGD
ncbi:uncharacterized protein BJX67DRAFT_203390 [Aspergillus lucknowensis]|uniref:Uncharacterized protein n=1 Tax=Aspergillus lucknowensis TaxID=176173 RepID=A0ABR4LJU4_9EURO